MNAAKLIEQPEDSGRVARCNSPVGCSTQEQPEDDLDAVLEKQKQRDLKRIDGVVNFALGFVAGCLFLGSLFLFAKF